MFRALCNVSMLQGFLMSACFLCGSFFFCNTTKSGFVWCVLLSLSTGVTANLRPKYQIPQDELRSSFMRSENVSVCYCFCWASVWYSWHRGCTSKRFLNFFPHLFPNGQTKCSQKFTDWKRIASTYQFCDFKGLELITKSNLELWTTKMLKYARSLILCYNCSTFGKSFADAHAQGCVVHKRCAFSRNNPPLEGGWLPSRNF